MKLLASAAAFLCVVGPVSSAFAAEKPVDFERRAPDSASARIVAPRAFSLVGLKWRGDAAPDVELRVKRARGWSRWRDLGVHGSGGSDPPGGGRAPTPDHRPSRPVPGARGRVRAGAER